MWYYMHSCFVENPPIDLEVMNPSFLRWFCHNHEEEEEVTDARSSRRFSASAEL
jgi:hypothetical protein